MRRIVMIVGCIGSCVLGAVAAAPALAAPPEWGQCVHVTPGTGQYSGKYCLAAARPGRGAYAFQAEPSAKPKYALNIEGTTLTSSSGRVIKCESGEGEGEYTGAKTTAIKTLGFRNCKVQGEIPVFESF